MNKAILDKLSQHPCFNEGACASHARIHLPVAPKCNVQCKFCNRKYDCVNESRPGVTSSVLSPDQALYYLDAASKRRKEQTGGEESYAVIGIAGPGDPFANREETLKTLRKVRSRYPDTMLCVATNGLNLYPSIDELAELEISHVTITINGIDPEIAGACYRWIRHGKKVYRGRAAGEVMIKEQLRSLDALVKKGILVKVNSIIIPGVNDHHLSEIAQEAGRRGAVTQNCLPLLPVKGTDFEDLPHPAHKDVQKIRKDSGRYISQMGHCRRCRADAAGLLEESLANGTPALLKEAASLPLNPYEERPFIAVATREGMLVNRHLGHSPSLCIYIKQKTGWTFFEERILPSPGGGDKRWTDLATALKDCSSLLVSGIGGRPQEVLTKQGIRVYLVEGMISEALEGISRGDDLRHMAVRTGICQGGSRGCA